MTLDLKFSDFPSPRDRVKCSGLGGVWGEYVFYCLALEKPTYKFQPSTVPRALLEVPGGVVEGWGVVVEAHFSVQLKPKPS